MLQFSDIESELAVCESHLMKIPNESDIQSFLTQFLLIRIHGKFEDEIGNILTNRIRRCNDSEIINFFQESFESYRHTKLQDLKSILKKFDENKKVSFDKKIRNTEPEIRYNNIMVNRNKAAHNAPIGMDFNELKRSYFEAKKVLIALESVL